MSQLQKALNMLLDLLDCGWEFPDASAKAAQNYHVKMDDLRAEYDNLNLEKESGNATR